MTRRSPSALKRKAASFIAEISEAELACRIAEAVLGLKRPPGQTAEQAMDGMDDAGLAFRHAARVAMDYWRECLNRGSVPS